MNRVIADRRPSVAVDSLKLVGLGLLSAVIVATPLIPSDAGSPRTGSGAMWMMMHLVLLAGWAMTTLREKHFRVRFSVIDLLVLLFILWLVVGSLANLGQTNGRYLLNVLWQQIALAANYWMLRQWCCSPVQQRALCVVLLGLATSLSMHGIYQYGYTLPRDRAEFREAPEEVLRRAGIHAPIGSPQRDLFRNRLESKEPFATYALANSLAGFLAPWLVIGTCAFLTYRNANRTDRVGLFGFGATVFLATSVVLLTKSRSAFAGCAAGLLAASFFAMRHRLRIGWKLPLIAIVLIAGLLIAGYAIGAIDLEVLTEARKSLGYRWEYWRATASMIAAFPGFGCGLGNFQETYAAYKLPQSSEMILDPHNFVLELSATCGIPATVLFLLVLASAVRMVQTVNNGREHDAISGIAARRAPSEPTTSQSPSPASIRGSSPIPAQVHPDAFTVRAVLVGGMFGPLLACLLAFDAMPSLEVILGAICVISVVGASLYRWIFEGTFPNCIPFCGIVALVVNLLAAGGISFAGVAINVWVLLAVVANGSPAATRDRILPGMFARLVLGTCVVVLVAFWLTVYGPKYNGQACEGRINAAMQLRQIDVALQQGERWVKEDPWSPTPHQQLAMIHFQQWQLTDDPQSLELLDRALEQALDRDPRSHIRHREAGNLCLRIWRMANDRRYLGKAKSHYQTAVKLYPNGSLNHAQLAWALALNGDAAEAVEQASEALRLDSLNPHRDQKLAMQRLFDIEPPTDLASRMPRFVDGDTPEQRMERLRSGDGSSSLLK